MRLTLFQGIFPTICVNDKHIGEVACVAHRAKSRVDIVNTGIAKAIRYYRFCQFCFFHDE
jgi:hypothetical protein